MPTIPPPPGLTPDDFETIEAAVLETPRGRWFLAEFARRIREQESSRLLDAVGKLERVVRDLAERPVAQPVPVLPEPAAMHALAPPAGARDREASPLLARIEAFGRGRRSRDAGGESEPAPAPIAAAPASSLAGDAFAPLEALSLAERLRLFH